MYLHSFKVPLRYVLTSKGKIVTLQGKIQQKPPFKWSSSTSPLIRHMTSCTLDMMLWEAHITSAVFLSKTQALSLRMRKHQTNLKWGTCYKTLTNTLQKDQDHKAKDRLKNCHRSEAIKEPWKLNGMWDPGTEKRHQWKSRWYLNKVCSFISSTVPELTSGFDHFSWWEKMLLFGEAG